MSDASDASDSTEKSLRGPRLRSNIHKVVVMNSDSIQPGMAETGCGARAPTSGARHPELMPVLSDWNRCHRSQVEISGTPEETFPGYRSHRSHHSVFEYEIVMTDLASPASLNHSMCYKSEG